MLLSSSSTRGTWIEIPNRMVIPACGISRPPHGGRGLKLDCQGLSERGYKSSSTRGTWIEIMFLMTNGDTLMVVLHTGDVD